MVTDPFASMWFDPVVERAIMSFAVYVIGESSTPVVAFRRVRITKSTFPPRPPLSEIVS